LIAIAVGFGVSQIEVPPGSRLNWLAFQGTADDARTLLISITSTVVTVIALVLGLTVIITGPEGAGRVVIPGNNFADYIFFIGGLIGRYGSSDLVVMLALLRCSRPLSRCFLQARNAWR
jgi:uncharacterized membrane protein